MALFQTNFPNARNFTINGGHFIGQANFNHGSDNDPVSTTLWQNVAAGAIFDSAERFPPAKCHPGTREKMIEKIAQWIENPTPTQRILWMCGPAGSGKSALAHTICERHKDKCKGSFFFARGLTDRGKGLKLFSTLSYQIALQFPSFRAALNEALYHDPSLPTKSMGSQLFSLIVQPLLRCTAFSGHSPILIIDGLDECADDQGMDTQRDIILLIAQSIVQYNIPLRFLIASRTESWIRDAFASSPLPSITLSLSLRDDKDADMDIKAYLIDEFEKIRLENKRIMGSVTPPWPPTGIIDHFVYEASGQYIYASTVLRFVGKSSKFSNPLEQLRILISPGAHRALALYELDRLYGTIVLAFPRWATMKRVLGGILVGANSTTIEQILGMDPTEFTLVMDALSPLVDVKMPTPLSYYEQQLETFYGSLTTGREKITLCHLSFREFLEDETRSGEFHVDVRDIIAEITKGFFGIIQRNVDQNYAVEPHLSFNVGFATYREMMYSMTWVKGGNHNTMIDLLLPLLADLTNSPRLPDPDLQMEYPGCFLQDMDLLKNLLDTVSDTYRHSEPEKNNDFLHGVSDLQDVVFLSRKRCIGGLSSSNKFIATPTLAYIAEVQSEWSPSVDQLFTGTPCTWLTIPDVLFTFQQHRHIINLDFSHRRDGILEAVTVDLHDIPMPYNVNHYHMEDEYWRFHGQWKDQRISLMFQFLNMILNDGFDDIDDKPEIYLHLAEFFQSRVLSDIRTRIYFEDPWNLSILALIIDFESAWTSPIPSSIQWKDFISSVLRWFNRQLTNFTTLNLLEEHDKNLVPRMRTAMEQIFEHMFLTQYRRSYFSELSISTPVETRSISLKVLPLPQGYHAEEIPYVSHEDFNYNWTWFHEEVFRTQEGPLTIEYFRWHRYLASYLLNVLAKHLYRRVNPIFKLQLAEFWEEQTEESFAYIIECLPYAETTQQNLDSLRAIAYLFTDAKLEWDPPMEFWFLTVDFLKKYDRSILSEEELSLFENWMFDMSCSDPPTTESPQAQDLP